ncbi:MAG: hypothetical protein LQ348_007530 [Seirophora lacunosa]|nr:MAG: hypothetical protein LQ344_003810 [Seirophora lacunosa]KAI4168262.1 MAG: hypothetical protein LQ348_007530 [Seirophora lacunosa]
MKFTIAIATLVALLPLALGAPASADLDESSAALGDTVELGESPFNVTAPETELGVPADFDESPFNASAPENELVERKSQSPKRSKLNVKAFRDPGCKGPLIEFNNVKYDSRNPAPFRSYSTSRKLKLGETLNLMSGSYGGDVCAKVTSFTPPTMGKGCHELGGNTAKKGSASCFRLWRRQGFIY